MGMKGGGESIGLRAMQWWHWLLHASVWVVCRRIRNMVDLVEKLEILIILIGKSMKTLFMLTIRKCILEEILF